MIWQDWNLAKSQQHRRKAPLRTTTRKIFRTYSTPRKSLLNPVWALGTAYSEHTSC